MVAFFVVAFLKKSERHNANRREKSVIFFVISEARQKLRHCNMLLSLRSRHGGMHCSFVPPDSGQAGMTLFLAT